MALDGTGQDREGAAPASMLVAGAAATDRTALASMHGVPERRSNERGGWGGVTPCVVPPPHRLPAKRATLTAKYDRLLAPRGCHGERHQWPVRLGGALPLSLFLFSESLTSGDVSSTRQQQSLTLLLLQLWFLTRRFFPDGTESAS